MNILLKDVSDDRIRNIINKQDEDGNTPLHYAVKIWPQNIVKDLLRFGADVSIKNKDDQIPLRKIPMETIVGFLDDHCMKTDGLVVLEEHEKDQDEAYTKLLDDYDPRFMTIYDKQKKYSITFDYEFLTPTQYCGSNDKHDVDDAPQAETSVLTAISNSMKHQELLLHPVLKSFVWIKWNLISRYYSRNLRIELLLLYFLTWYIFSQFAGLEWQNRCEFQTTLSNDGTKFCDEIKRRHDEINTKKYGEKESMAVGERLGRFFAGRAGGNRAGTFGDTCMYTHGAYICFIPLSLLIFYWMFKDIKRLFFSPNPYAHGGKPSPKDITFYSTVVPIVLDLISFVLIISVLVFSGGILWIVITVLYVISCYFEIRQFLASPMVHFKRSTNWGDFILYILIAVVVYVPNNWISDPVYYSQSGSLNKVCGEDFKGEFNQNVEGDVSVKRGIAGFLIVLSWTRFIFHVAKNPGRITEKFNKYSMMYQRVATSFLNILMVYSFFIISFAMGFYIMFHNDIGKDKIVGTDPLSNYVFFETPYESLVKTVAMFIGEVDFNNIPIGLSYGRRDGNVSATLGYLYFLVFMLMVTLVLMNLLNGLAVTDITAIIEESETLHQISMINILEEFEDHALNTRKSLDMISKCCPCLKENLLRFLDLSGDFLLFHSKKTSDTKKDNTDDEMDKMEKVVQKDGRNDKMERNTKIKTLPDWKIPSADGCLRTIIHKYLGTSRKHGCEVIVAEARKRLLLRQKTKMDKKAKEKKEERDREEERQKTICLFKQAMKD